MPCALADIVVGVATQSQVRDAGGAQVVQADGHAASGGLLVQGGAIHSSNAKVAAERGSTVIARAEKRARPVALALHGFEQRNQDGFEWKGANFVRLAVRLGEQVDGPRSKILLSVDGDHPVFEVDAVDEVERGDFAWASEQISLQGIDASPANWHRFAA